MPNADWLRHREVTYATVWLVMHNVLIISYQSVHASGKASMQADATQKGQHYLSQSQVKGFASQ